MASAESAGARILLVVLTLGRRDDYLVQTLTSIRDQTGEAADIVVVLPVDAVRTRAIAADFGARVVDDPGGMSAAVNAGLRAADTRHVYANWIGDDDVLTPGSLAAAATTLDENPAASVAFGNCEYIDAHGRRLWTNRTGRIAPWLMTWGPDLVPQPGALFRTAGLREVGMLDAQLSYAMDLDLWLRLRRTGRIVYTGKTLAAFRWHPTSSTVANRPASLAEAEAVKRRYYGPLQRRLAFLWERPVRLATRLAARRLNVRAVRRGQNG